MNEQIQFLLYSLPEEEGKVQVVIKDETIWATKVLKEFIKKGHCCPPKVMDSNSEK